MAWCEANGVHFVFGLAQNDRLNAEIASEFEAVKEKSERTGKPARRFKEFKWRTRKSWSRERRVVAKAEWANGDANPRFVVTSLKRAECKPRHLYERVYCARGDMENRIKECQLDLYADRTSAATMRANQLRLWFASMGASAVLWTDGPIQVDEFPDELAGDFRAHPGGGGSPTRPWRPATSRQRCQRWWSRPTARMRVGLRSSSVWVGSEQCM
jgi:hypothetical protein